MGILKEFERSLEGSVEGFFGRVFRSRLQPLELAKALERYAQDHKLVAADGTVVQNVYEFTVGAKDHDRLDELGDKLVHGLAEVVRRNAEQRGHRLVGPVVVRLRRDDAVRVGMFELAGRVDPRVAATPRGDHLPTPSDDVPASEQLFGRGARRRDRSPTPPAIGPQPDAEAAGADAQAAAAAPLTPQVEDPDAAAVAADLDTPPAWAREPAPGLPDVPPPFSLDPPGPEAPLFPPAPPASAPGTAEPADPASAATAVAEHHDGADPATGPGDTARDATGAPDAQRDEPRHADTGYGDTDHDNSKNDAEDGDVDAPAAERDDVEPAPDATVLPVEGDPPRPVDPTPLARPRARLAVRTAGASRAGSIDLVGGRLLVGRHRDCDLRLDDTTVSREHAAFVRRGATWWVLDLGSTNGTSVNGVGAAEQALSDGDTVGVGDVELVFREG